jgi:hypothetical protein
MLCHTGQSAASFSLQEPTFSPKLMHVGFVVNKVALQHIFPPPTHTQNYGFPFPVIILSGVPSACVITIIIIIKGWYNRPVWFCNVNRVILIYKVFLMPWTWVSSVAQWVTRDWMTRWLGFDPQQRQRIFPLASMSRQALRPLQPPIQLVLGILSWGAKCSHLVSRTRMSRSYTSSPPCCLCGGSRTALL